MNLQKHYTKIITHDGVFHADEILAIATVFSFYGKLPIERKSSVTEEELNDSSILVLDIGRKFSKNFGNYDHHQSDSYSSTCKLILWSFCENYKLKYKLNDLLYDYVDKVDRGEIIENGKVPTFSTIIRHFNNLQNGFDLALEFAKNTLKSVIETASLFFKEEDYWDNSVVKETGYAISDIKLTQWKDFAIKDYILYFICPNDRSGGYRLTSINSEKYYIPASENQKFRHNSGFLAVYDTKEEAINDAKKLFRNFSFLERGFI